MTAQLYYIAPESVTGSSDLLPYGDLGYGDLEWTNAAVQTKSPVSFADLSIDESEYVEPESSWTSLFNMDLLNQSAICYAPDWKSSSTSSFKEGLQNRYAEKISAYVKRLFSMAENIEFEVGMTNGFSEALERWIEVIGVRMLVEIRRIILNEETSLTVAAETMRYIGNIESPKYHAERRELLETCLLNSRFAWVRDGAGLGLASLDDPQSIPVLEMVISKESNEELKEDLIQVLEQLEDTLLES